MNYMDFIKPELVILVPVLYFVGVGVKRSPSVKDWLTPYILGGAGVMLSVLWVVATSTLGSYREVAMAVFVALTQGVLAAGLSVYGDQLAKQWRKDE